MPNSNMVAEWKTAKKEFEKVTGAKRPKESFLKVFSKGSGIEPALKKCDELANISMKDRKSDTAAKLKAAVKDLDEKVKAYLKLLDTAIKAEPAKSDMDRALKALRAKTDKFGPHYAVSILELETKNPMDLVNTIGGPMLKKAVASALADVKRVLAKPDWRTYEAVMSGGNGAGRRLTTALQSLVNSDLDTAGYKARLNEYATGTKMNMSAQATKDDVLTEIKAFQRIVKDLAKDMEK